MTFTWFHLRKILVLPTHRIPSHVFCFTWIFDVLPVRWLQCSWVFFIFLFWSSEKIPIIALITHRFIHIPSLYALSFVVAAIFLYVVLSFVPFCLTPVDSVWSELWRVIYLYSIWSFDDLFSRDIVYHLVWMVRWNWVPTSLVYFEIILICIFLNRPDFARNVII